MTSLDDAHRSAVGQHVVGITAAPAVDQQLLLDELGTDGGTGLTAAVVAERQAQWGPNVVSPATVRFLPVLWRQLRSPLLLLLVTAATASFFLGERADAVIIGVIVAVSVGLGCANEWRAEQAAQALRSRIRYSSVVVRDGGQQSVDVSSLVPGDVVDLSPGDVVPADLLWVFSAGPAEFRSGWFVESLATQTLVVLAIRTQRVPFFRSRPSVPLLASVVGVVTVGAALPFTPLAGALGFARLPAGFFAALVGLVAAYLVLIELGKRLFYRSIARPVRTPTPRRPHDRHLLRRARRFNGPFDVGSSP